MRQFLRTTFLATLVSLTGAGSCFAQGGYGTTLAADIAFPAGVFAQSFKTGYGAHVEFFMAEENYLRLYVLLGYDRWGIDNDKINQQYLSLGGSGTLQLDGHMSSFPLLVGARLLSPPGNFRFYGLLEGGVYFYSGKITGQKVENGVVTQNIYADKSRTEPGVNLGAGLLQSVGKEVSLDAAVRYHFVKTDTYYNYDLYGTPSAVSTSKYFSLALGVTYSFAIPSNQ